MTWTWISIISVPINGILDIRKLKDIQARDIVKGGRGSAVRELLDPELQLQTPVYSTPNIFITMRSLSPALASLANVFRIPVSMAPVRPTISSIYRETLAQRQTPQAAPITAAIQSAPFSSSSSLEKRKGGGPGVDKRISTFPPTFGTLLRSLIVSP